MLLQMALFHSFLCLSNSPLYTCTTSSISIPLSMGISVGSVLAVVNSAAMNIGVHLSFQIMFFSRWMPNSGIAGSYVKPGRRKWQPTPVFLLENPIDGGVWQAIVHGVRKESDD